ncbi:vasopressin V1a receptor-like [Tropilaelaps mercedesae]|uniref:Vasopressin V1a receptor-like n=1 Tax=Tropilaelaps mercedesae TaxID=418985 RepID=A0A1V9XJ59_9ACAR|nr:vasopressin V1a receptor-like [Tropilaelaps mercedesae]
MDRIDGDGGDEVVMLEPEHWVSSLKCSTLLVIFIMTLSSNLFVLWAVFLRRRLSRFCAGPVYGKIPTDVKRNCSLSRVQLFIIHLSMADILVALLNILPQLAWDITVRFEGGFALCKFVKYAQVLVLYLSTYILTGMSLDRLISMRAIYAQWKMGMHTSNPTSGINSAVATSLRRSGISMSGSGVKLVSHHCHHLNSHHSRVGYRKLAKMLIAFAWLLSAVLALPQLFIFSYTASSYTAPTVSAVAGKEALDSQGVFSTTVFTSPAAVPNSTAIAKRYDCLADFSWHPYGMEIYVTSFVVIVLGVPALLMLFCYGYMCVIILRIQRSYASGESLLLPTTQCDGRGVGGFATSSKRLTAAKVRLVKMTFLVVLAFIVCWSPFCVAELIRAYTLPVDNAHVNPIFMVFLLLASLNSAVNPWIYAAFCINRFAKHHSDKAKMSLVRYK